MAEQLLDALVICGSVRKSSYNAALHWRRWSGRHH